MNMIKSIIKQPAIIILLVVIVLILILFAVKSVLNSVSGNEKTPIKSIEAINENIYSSDMYIKPEDFEVFAVHENGKKTNLSSERIMIDKDTPAIVGDTTTVTVSLIDNEKINCQVDVLCQREKVLEFECGNLVLSDIKAVLYSNGELCFEGQGDILRFSDNNYPWKSYEEQETYPIRSVTFESTITPTTLDSMFSGISTLQYIDSLPQTIQSARYAFSDCDSILEAADWLNCMSLLDITGMYEDCDSLFVVPEIPEFVRNASGVFAGCDSLQTTPIMEHAINIESASQMYMNCTKLTTINTLPPNVKNISQMFAGCINLMNMPEIPESVLYMDSAFEGDVSLSYLTIIPVNVKSVQSCFSGCKMINGLLWVDANPSNYSNFLENAAYATQVDLQGNSKMLNELGKSSENDNITVNNEPIDYSQ